MSQDAEAFSVSPRTALFIAGLCLVPAAAVVALMFVSMDPADEIPLWVLILLLLVVLLPLLVVRKRFGRRRWRDAIVVSRQGLYLRNEATALIPWAAISRVMLLEQTILSGAGRYAVPVADQSLVLEGPGLARYRSTTGVGEIGAWRRRGFVDTDDKLLVILSMAKPVRGDRPGWFRVARSIHRFAPVERHERKTFMGEWTPLPWPEDGAP